MKVNVTIHADNHTPQCPLSPFAQERLRHCPQAKICNPINILYVDTHPLIALAESYFLFIVCMGEMLELTFDQYLETVQGGL